MQDDLHKKEKQEFEDLQRAMQKERMKQLRDANEEEDRTIKQLEKRLKLAKRKSKSLPKTFVADGLDCTLKNIFEIFCLYFYLFHFFHVISFHNVHKLYLNILIFDNILL